jgi:hypothetical protein
MTIRPRPSGHARRARSSGRSRRLPGHEPTGTTHPIHVVTIAPSPDVATVRLGLAQGAGAWDHTAFVRQIVPVTD